MAGVSSQLQVPFLTLEELLSRRPALVVDLRSPKEFEQDHYPGARNVPLFDDVERELIGTLYARRSPEEAFEHARETVVARIQGLVARIARLAGWSRPEADLAQKVREMTAAGMAGFERELTPGPFRSGTSTVVFSCWRGGLRSQSLVALLEGLGFDVACLQGGYKAYRRHVIDRLLAWEAPPTYVLRGLTGVGKTLILREIERLRPGSTLDLEGLAGHRSSVLGMVGLRPCSQKTFESRLVSRLERGFPGFCVIEGESRKVGDAILPKSVWEALRDGHALELAAPLSRRVQVLLDDYLVTEANRDELARQLPFLEERMGRTKWKGVLVGWLCGGEEERLVEALLEHYYDPLYRHSEGKRSYTRTFEVDDEGRDARRILEWIEGQERALSPAPRNSRTASKKSSGASSQGM